MNAVIHPTALVHPGAKLGAGCRVGAYSVIDEHVVVGEGTEIKEHVVLRAHVELGKDVRVFPHAVLGEEPQHLRYKGEPTRVRVGDRTLIREFVTIHRGTEFGGGLTTVGEDSMIMAYSHIAHDCHVGKKVIIANALQLAGHVEIGDFVIMGGQVGLPPFSRVGRYCFIAGASVPRKDVPPFLTGKGNDFVVQGVNLVGLERNGFTPERISTIKKLYRLFYRRPELTVSHAIETAIQELGNGPDVTEFIQFVQTSKVGIIR